MAKVRIQTIVTGYYEDRGTDSDLLVFSNDEDEAEMVEALAEVYGLDEDEDGKPAEVGTTWDWLEEQIGAYAWWVYDERTIKVRDYAPTKEEL